MPALPGLDSAIPTQRTRSSEVSATPQAPPGQPPAPPQRPAVVEPCACGHARAAHEHYRPGTDCGACGAEGCEMFRAEGGRLRRLFRRMGLTA
jgi:hypothetical protein